MGGHTEVYKGPLRKQAEFVVVFEVRSPGGEFDSYFDWFILQRKMGARQRPGLQFMFNMHPGGEESELTAG